MNEIHAFQGKIEKRGMGPCDRPFTPRSGRVSDDDDDDYYIITMSAKEASKGEIKMTTKRICHFLSFFWADKANKRAHKRAHEGARLG